MLDRICNFYLAFFFFSSPWNARKCLHVCLPGVETYSRHCLSEMDGDSATQALHMDDHWKSASKQQAVSFLPKLGPKLRRLNSSGDEHSFKDLSVAATSTKRPGV